MPQTRCRACHCRFIARRPADRYCNACWATRRAGFSPAWLLERELEVGREVDRAVSHDDERERR